MVHTKKLNPLLDAIPVCSAILTSTQEVIFVNPLWEEERERHAESGLFSMPGEIWPSPSLEPKLKEAFIDGMCKVAQGRMNLLRQSSVSQSGKYRYNLATFVSQFKSGSETYFLVCNRVNLDSYFGNDDINLVPPEAFPLLNALSEGVVVQDQDGVITANNPASEQILGLTSDQMRGRSNTDPRWGTIHEDGTPCPPAEHPSTIALQTGKPVYDFVIGVHLPDSSLRWLKVNSRPLFFGESTESRMTVTTFSDITELKEKEIALRSAKSRLQLSLDVAHIGVWDYTIKTNELKWDDNMRELFEVEPDECAGLLTDWSRFLVEEDKDRILNEFKDVIKHKEELISEFRIMTLKGNLKHIKVAAKVERDSKGWAHSITGINTDITLEKTITEAVEASRRKLQSFIEHLPSGAFFVEFGKVTLNVRAEEITGYDRRELSSIESLFTNLFPDLNKEQNELYQCIIAGKIGEKPIVLDIVHHNGEQRWIDFRGCIVDDAQAWVMKDITEQIVAENNLKQLAYYDVLTKLPNRAAVEAQMQEAIYRAERKKTKLGILLIDLDLFKNVNDTYGHPVGDQLLVAVANRLNTRIRKSDIFGRLGGDEFLLIIEDAIDAEYLARLGQHLLECVEPVFELEHNVSVTIKMSIGISIFPDHGEDSVHLFRNADTALYKAKSLGRNICQVYDQSFTVALRTRLTLEQRIEKAIEEKQFFIQYQPMLCCKSGKVLGAEALMRWVDSELGFVSPGDFIPVAEESGLIIPLGSWAIDEICKQFSEWHKIGLGLEHIAINISALQFSEPGLFELIKATLDKYQLTPGQLDLEITESILMQNQANSKKTLIDLKSMGVRLSIDDFGTGYSSLSYLKSFSVDSLKIDRSFVKDIPGDEHDVQITSAIISMAKNLNLEVVAEGVETEEQMNFVREQGCDLFQGFLVSPALVPEEFEKLARERNS